MEFDILKKNPLDKNISVGEAISYEALSYSDVTTVNGRTFQGHLYLVHSGEEAVQSHRAIYQK